MSHSLPTTLAKDKRIRKRRDFLRVQKHGLRTFGRFVVAVMQPDKDMSEGRFGITVSKKVGPAHIRNKVKRRIRHVLRLNQTFFFERLLVIVAKDCAGCAPFSELQADLIATCRRLKRNKIRAPRHPNCAHKVA